ncbi:MAG: glycoside hydrolase family 19 protein [Cyanobacteria bacterium P01_D01_bin.156]
MVRFILTALVSLVFLLVTPPALAQSATSTALYQVPQDDGTVLEGEIFDLSQMAIDDFGAIDLSDETAQAQLSEIAPTINLAHLQPGNLVAAQDYLTLNLLDTAFGVGEWSLRDIARQTSVSLGEIPLSAYGDAMGNVSLGELAHAIPEFARSTANQNSIFMAAIDTYQAQLSNTNHSLNRDLRQVGYDNAYSVQEILDGYTPGLADLQLKSLDEQLNQWSVLDIPGLSTTPIQELDSLENAFVGDFEALGLTDKLTLSAFPNPPVLNDIIRMGRFDVPLGEPEHNRLRVVSGGVTRGDKFKGEPCDGGGCIHVELDEVGAPPSSGLSGFAWMTSDQQVRDGYGPLCAPFGCKGPAGNHPFGKGFRVLFSNLNEAEGSVQVSISFRACRRIVFVKTCTPYVFPTPKGILIGSIQEKAIFPVTPPDIKLSGDDFNYGNTGYGRTGNRYGRNPCFSGADAVTGDIVDRAIEALLTVPLYDRQGRLVAHGWDEAGVREHAPLLIGAALEQGVTDPAHIAYILATTGHEALFRGPIEEFESGWRRRTGPGDYGAVHRATGHRYYGRGYVQITWATNYQKIDQVLGTNTYHNPDQMLDPAVAAPATVIGMRDGIFTARSLDDYGYGDNFDWNGARSIINNGDLRSTIGGYGQHIYEYIRNTDTDDVQRSDGTSTCGTGDGSVTSPLGGTSLEDLLNTYQLADFQRFDAYRAYRNGWHGGIDLDYRAGGGAGGAVNSVSQGTVVSVAQIGHARATGEPSVQVVVMTTDSLGRQIEQRYNHLSLSSVQAATGCGLGACNVPVGSGTPIGAVGQEDTLSRGAHLDYKVKIDGQFVDPWGFLQVQAAGGSGTINTINLATGAIGSIDVAPLSVPTPDEEATVPAS